MNEDAWLEAAYEDRSTGGADYVPDVVIEEVCDLCGTYYAECDCED